MGTAPLVGDGGLVGLSQRGLRRGEAGIGRQRLREQRIERFRAEKRPPLPGNVGANNEALRRPSGDVRRGGLGR